VAKFGHVRKLPYEPKIKDKDGNVVEDKNGNPKTRPAYQARWKISGKVHTARDCEDWRKRNKSRGLPEDNWDYGGLTFSSAELAEKYLEWVQDKRERGRWREPIKKQPDATSPLFFPWATKWIAERRNQKGLLLKATTKAHYRRLLAREVAPKLGATSRPDTFSESCRGSLRGEGHGAGQIPDHAECKTCPCPCHTVTLEDAADHVTFEKWYRSLDVDDEPVQTAHTYDLVRAILRTAHRTKPVPLIDAVPEIEGASATKKRKRSLRLISLDELAQLTACMPARYRLVVTLYAWCAIRYGELAALRKSHIDIRHKCKRPSPQACTSAGCVGIVRVEVGVTRADGEWHEDTPKSGEGGDVPIPPHVLVDVDEHLSHIARDADLVFPGPGGGFLYGAEFHKHFRRAKEAIGRPDIRPHDLRHLGSVLVAQEGASLPEIMQRLRHKTVQAAMVYMHVAEGRDRELAGNMSERALAKVVPIDSARSAKRPA
jgi:integrase